jgi:alkaline phosphatase
MTRKRRWLNLGIVVILFIMGASGMVPAQVAAATAKYIFVFIGDGMGVAQRNAAELYMANMKGVDRPERTKLVMNTFPAQGMNTTYDLSSVIPDSALTATAIACGFKTKSGVIGMDAGGKVSYENIAEVAKKQGWKVGILSSVSLDHATPAAFYAHVPSRRLMYDISMHLVNSGFNYFACGQMLEMKDKKDPNKPDALEVARRNGYIIAMGRTGFDQLKRKVARSLP